jgi:hypothetical protein
MIFIGIELSPAGSRAVALDVESAAIWAEARVPQQHLVDIRHPAGGL